MGTSTPEPDPDRYGTIVDVLDVARGVADEIRTWSTEYLRALERQTSGVTAGQTAPLNRPTVTHSGVWRPEERPPACITWVAGEAEHHVDPDGRLTVQLEVGVAVIVAAPTAASTATLLHRHVAAVRKLLTDRPTASGTCRALRLVDVDYTPVDPETQGRTVARADLMWLAHGVCLGVAGDGPGPDDDPRSNPVPPWPPVPTFLDADLQVDPLQATEYLDP
ncbi:MAG: hypothetical protein M0P31_15430 [Solirubrobacteraceae bacterium]|nr:hypothetical protein [Solirubrobacteraceae bacterium]